MKTNMKRKNCPSSPHKYCTWNCGSSIPLLRLLAFLFLVLIPIREAAGQEPIGPAPPPYQPLRYDEDYRYLRDASRRTDAWDVLKYIPLDRTGSRYLSLGGEMRERLDYFHNPQWGLTPTTNEAYLLHRYHLHVDLHLGPNLRLFGQFKSGLQNSPYGNPRPTDEDTLDLNQFFVENAVSWPGTKSLRLRLGRQEMAYGSSRLVSTREGTNVRESFQGIRATWQDPRWSVDLFATRPVTTRRHAFDDGPDPERAFWGLYTVGPFSLLPGGKIDLYWLGLDRRTAKFNQGAATETRYSTGTRLWGQHAGWDYNTELTYQWGHFGKGQIKAWALSTETGYRFRNVRYQPRFGLKADIASGDRDLRNNNLETFHPLFPKATYFGDVSLIGQANLIDVHPSIELQLSRQIAFTADWDVFWRQSREDGVYSAGINLLRPGKGSPATYIGNQLSGQMLWRIDRHATLTAVYSHFFAGRFLKETSARDLDYFSGWLTYKF